MVNEPKISTEQLVFYKPAANTSNAPNHSMKHCYDTVLQTSAPCSVRLLFVGRLLLQLLVF